MEGFDLSNLDMAESTRRRYEDRTVAHEADNGFIKSDLHLFSPIVLPRSFRGDGWIFFVDAVEVFGRQSERPS